MNVFELAVDTMLQLLDRDAVFLSHRLLRLAEAVALAAQAALARCFLVCEEEKEKITGH